MEDIEAHQHLNDSTETPKRTPEVRKRSPLIYATGFVCVPFLYLMVVFAVSSKPSVFYWLARKNFPALGSVGYGARLHDANCRVVVYGDSTALTGVDPRVIESVTGMKACNVAEVGWVPIVTGSERPLDVYLEHNSKPEVILMMFNPALFQPYKEPFAGYGVEGMAYLAMFDRRPAVYWAMLQRPKWLAQYLIWMGNALVHSASHPQSHTPFGDPAQQRMESGGYLAAPYATETKCVRTNVPLKEPVARWADSVATMRTKYATRAKYVILDIAPPADCDVNQADYRKQSEDLHDNTFRTYPITFFNEGEVHYSPAGARYLSIELGQQILTTLAGSRGTSAGTAPAGAFEGQ